MDFKTVYSILSSYYFRLNVQIFQTATLVKAFVNTYAHAHICMYVCMYVCMYEYIYCIKGNVNVYLIFPNLPNGFETGTIKTLSLIIFVGMLGQAMFVFRFRLSNTAVYLSNSLAHQMATYVI